MAFEKDPNEIGTLWKKSGAKGEYMTGEIAGQKVVCFAVKSDNPKAPAWRVLKSQPKDAAQPVTDRDVPF
jgi:hypothetical protein